MIFYQGGLCSQTESQDEPSFLELLLSGTKENIVTETEVLTPLSEGQGALPVGSE